MRNLAILLLLIAGCTQPPPPMEFPSDITLELPVPRLIVQRDANKRANVPIRGIVPQLAATLRVQLTPRQGGKAVALDLPVQNGRVDASITAMSGWYDCTTTALNASGRELAQTTVQRVGVGECFMTFGHSVPQGDDVGPGATDDRACTLDFYTTTPTDTLPLTFRHIDENARLGPFNMTAAWGRLADLLIQQLDCPVLIYGACFGGSNLEQCVNVIQQRPFTHQFVTYAKRYPIFQAEAVMKRYVPITGLRAVLMHHGVNDRYTGSTPTPTATMVERHRIVLDHLRTLAAKPDLHVFIAQDSPMNGGDPGNTLEYVRAAQAQIPSAIAHCSVGADLRNVPNTAPYRTDGVHLDNPQGLLSYAAAWHRVLTPEALAKAAVPLLPGSVEDGPAWLTNLPVNPLAAVCFISVVALLWSLFTGRTRSAGLTAAAALLTGGLWLSQRDRTTDFSLTLR
jgi:hypothetical protein